MEISGIFQKYFDIPVLARGSRASFYGTTQEPVNPLDDSRLI